jgi:Ca2+-binding RTX toxin-like protein
MGQQRGRNDGGEVAIQRIPRAGRLAAGAGLALGATLVTTGSAQAADFTVTNTAPTGPGSLRDAIDQANTAAGPDRVLFQSGLSGTINLNQPTEYGALEILEALEIVGPGADQLTVSANAESRVFEVYTAEGDDVTISGLKIIQGNAKYTEGPPLGGNIFSPDADLTVSSSVIRSGTAIIGAGINSQGPSTTLVDSTVSGNIATFAGGGLASYATGDGETASITGTTFANNAAGTKYDFATRTEPSPRPAGGGGAVLFGTAAIENSTFAGNATGADGGAILNGPYGPTALTVRSTTISGNEAGAGGGIYSYTYEGQGTPPPNPLIENSIVAGNKADNLVNGPDLAGGPFDAAFSLIQVPSDVTINETVPGSNIFGVNPLLAALDSNGGPTQTMALIAGSPATDAGRTPAGETTDQRGEARPVDLADVPNSAATGADGADMGAYERQAPPPPPPPTGSCNGTPATISGTPARDIINGTSGPDVIVGFGGNDEIRGFGGNDLICPGDGRDEVTAGGDEDRILGSGGNDRLYGQRGDDTITDNAGADLLSGGLQNDTMRGGGNEDRVLGANGNDRLFGQGDDDVVLGAKGNDFVRGGQGNDRVSGGVGVNDVQQ